MITNKHNGHDGSRRPEEIQAEIARTRSELDETLSQIEQRLTPGQLVDQGLNYLRGSGARQYVRHLGESVQRDPLPLALVGVGLAWLMLSDRGRARAERYDVDGDWGPSLKDSEPSISQRMADGARRLADKVRDVGDRAGEMADRAGERLHEARDGASSLGQSARESATAFGDSARERASHLADGARGSARSVAAGAREMAGTVRDRASQAADTARQRMASAADTARQQAERVRLGVDHLVNEQPLALGAIGLAVGALLGAAMPRTRQEDRMMGATRDRLVHDAEGALREPLERATQAASAAADAAVDTFRFETGEGPSSQGASKASSSASSSGPSSTSSSRDGSSEGFGQGSDLPSAAQSPTTPSSSVSTSGRPFPEAKGPGPQESGPGYESPRGAAPMSSTQYDVEDVDMAANRQGALGLDGDEPGAGTRAGDASGNPPAGR